MPPPVPKGDDPVTITIRVDGVPYVFRPGEVSALDVSACRRATGMGVNGVIAAAANDPDIDIIGAIVWLARRQAGEHTLTYEAVLSEISYDSDIDVDELPESEAADVGEVHAVS